MTFFQLIGDPDFQHKYVLERIIGHVVGRSREDLIRHYDDEVEQDALKEIQKLYDLYALENYPLEYILGYVEYGGLRFHVSESTIIPRPETEDMIEAVREYCDGGVINGKTLLVDVGTGSGVLAFSILHSHGQQISQAFLIDMSEDALAIARKNYKNFLEQEKIDKTPEVVIEKGNLFDRNLLEKTFSENLRGESVRIILTANLPYIPDEDFDTNPDRTIKYEPRMAFVGGQDGLDLYREMFAQIATKSFLNSSSGEDVERDMTENSIVMFLEMMTWQVDILRQEFDWLEFEEIKTFHANIRIVKCMVK